MEKYIYEDNFLKVLIEEDSVGFYLIVYKNPSSEKSTNDYLCDTLDEAFQKAKNQFGITKDQWRE